MAREHVARIRELVAELAAKGVPKVWVGEAGMTADELLRLQETNDGLPEWMRVEPGEFVAIEGSEANQGIQMPEPSVNWIDGHEALCSGVVPPDLYWEVLEHVEAARAAERGEVLLSLAYSVSFVPMDRISSEDAMVAKGVTRDGRVLVPGRSEYATLPLEELTPDEVDQDVCSDLQYWLDSGLEPFVVEDSPKARQLVAARLGLG